MGRKKQRHAVHFIKINTKWEFHSIFWLFHLLSLDDPVNKMSLNTDKTNKNIPLFNDPKGTHTTLYKGIEKFGNSISIEHPTLNKLASLRTNNNG